MNPGGSLLRVVLDTNVLFSALALRKDSPPFRILELARDGKIVAVVSPFILAELERNLREKAGWELAPLVDLRRKLKGFLTLVETRSRVTVIKRVVADNRILECVVDAGAHVLITGDKKDIRPLGTFGGAKILTPREFLDEYFE